MYSRSYSLQNKIASIPRKHKIYAAGDGRHRAAIVVTNNLLDSILFRQLSDEDTVVLEVVSGKAKPIVASMYFDITRQIEDELNKIEAIVKYAKGAGVLLAIDSNSRSRRGRTPRPIQEEDSLRNSLSVYNYT